jgi:hypothetical protein
MLTKIRVRSLLLKSFENTRFGTNPYKLHPLAHYVYYDSLNAWLPILKKQYDDVYDMAAELVRRTNDGISPEKYLKYISEASEGDPYSEDDLIDEDILKHVNSLTDGDHGLKTVMYGGITILKYR